MSKQLDLIEGLPAKFPKIHEEFVGKGIDKIMKTIKIQTQMAWLATYEDPEWIVQEIKKALTWIIENPKRKPKIFSRFMVNWLSRGWERKRKNSPMGDDWKMEDWSTDE